MRVEASARSGLNDAVHMSDNALAEQAFFHGVTLPWGEC